MKSKNSARLLTLLAAFSLVACGPKPTTNSSHEESKEPTSSEIESSIDSEEVESASNSSSSKQESSSSSSDNDHTHTWDTNWSSDADYHWHKCTGTISNGNTGDNPWGGGWGGGWGGWGGTPCSEVQDKAKHTFDQGKITTPATAYGEGVKTYTCTVCKYAKTESIPATGGNETLGNFSFNSDITTPQEIHTADQKKFLSWGGDYYNGLNPTVLTSLNAKGDSDKSQPNKVKVTWNYTAPSGKTVNNYTFVTGQESDLSDGYVINGTTAKEISFYNPFIGDNYFKVIANLSDGTSEASEIKIFKVDETAPRNLKIGSMANCRDMGGRKTAAGGKIKQGLIYRTAEPGSNPSQEVKDELMKRFKVKSEVYVKDGGGTSSPLGSSVTYYNCSMDYGTSSYSNMSRNAERLRKVFSHLADERNYPTFYHCRIGTDRTGIVAIALNGLLGVDFNETIADHAFSNYAPIDGQRYAHLSNYQTDTNGDDIAKYVDEILAMPGKNFQEKTYYSLLSIGIPAADLNKIIDFLTEGPKATLPTNISVGRGNDITGTGTRKTASDFKNPDSYLELTNGKTASYKVNMAKDGKANVVTYIGCTNKSSSTKLANVISLKIDGVEKTIVDKTTEKAGFGNPGGRTAYMFNLLGEYDLSAGEHEITITNKSSSTVNVGTIDVIADGTSSSGGGGTTTPETPVAKSYEYTAAQCTSGQKNPVSTNKDTRLGKNNIFDDVWNIDGIEAGKYEVYLNAQCSAGNANKGYWNSATAVAKGDSEGNNGGAELSKLYKYTVKVDSGAETNLGGATETYADTGLNESGAAWTSKALATIDIASGAKTLTLHNNNNGYSIWVYGIRLVKVA
ncbi:MAG: tyrosine-protein phosphatase [Bacilli bacterium]|nr:tyrosine-protein phosphatase [Bacilli bacterium]